MTTTPFSPAAAAWFAQSFAAPTEVQRRGWEAIAAGRHALLVAPTGSGKTLAAFLWAVDRLCQEPADAPAGVRVVYVSPLKALVYDVERNLRAPLAGVQRTAERLGLPVRVPRVDVRTGDTPQRERQRQAREPGEILVTTPESLYLVLGSRAGEGLAGVTTVIVDEIHALAPEKRGVHLALSLERLAARAARDPQRIGLSATARPLEEVARFLGGDRSVEIVDASAPPALELELLVPVADMERPPPAAVPEPAPGGSLLAELWRQESGAPAAERGLWPAIEAEVLAQIRAHRSTIVFVNSRGLCERLAQRLNELAGEELVLAHHGSVSHGKRAAIEDALKAGRLRGLVATSSLELGIDMGAVDLVLCVESPGSVARGLQRVGRAGHGVGESSRGRLLPKFRGDLLECAVVAQGMLAGAIEALRVPRNVLDVLAQQIVALCCEAPRSVAEIEALVRRAHPYRALSGEALAGVLDMLAGRYPSTDFADLRPRLAWDRARDVLSARRGAQLVARLGAGTIPDRGAFGVVLAPEGPRVGELDEEMVYESRAGDVIQLGASSWRVQEITRDRVLVTPAPGEPGRLPFWKGEGPGRPIELGRALGAFTRELAAVPRESAEEWLRSRLPLSEHAAANLADYVAAQREATGAVPSDRTIVVERFRDELGDWRVCVLTPFGARVHAPWALAIEELLGARGGEVQVACTDDGIVLRWADGEEAPALDALWIEPEELEELVTRRVGKSSLFASLFRENAVRSLLIERRRPEQRSPLWAQRLKTRALLGAVEGYPDFPIVLETYRQALGDHFDLPALEELLRAVRSREIGVLEVETDGPSPFARSLVFAWVAEWLYEGDSPAAERRARALTLDRGLLRELLGQAELRELIDAAVLAELEEELACAAEGRRARDADELHDLLRRLGDLARGELSGRCVAQGEELDRWLARLSREGRAAVVRVAGEERWIAAEDAGLYRDALGCNPPSGLPSAFLAPVPDALAPLLRRFARGRGPFAEAAARARFDLAGARLAPQLAELERAGVLVSGELRPGGRGIEWCDAEVLRALKRRTLARLRGEAQAVDAPALARFLPRWQGVGSEREGHERLLEVVGQLEGLALPWSSLALEILPRRVAGFAPELLDLACASGEVVWVGRGALGPRDGKVALYLREHAGALVEPPPPLEGAGALHAALLERLAARGACFLVELERAARERLGAELATAEIERALEELVWQGHVTNDTVQPLRRMGAAKRRARSGAPRLRRPSLRRQAWREGLGGGRWSLVAELGDASTPPTERALARAHVLLARYGIVGREAAQAEGLEGGFAPLRRVLQALEDAGRVRRGWFVDALAGAQFATPGAVDHLRAAREETGEPALLPALDPAQPYGALLPWPVAGFDGAAPRRVAGAWTCLVDGRLAWYVPPSRRQLVTFPGELDPGEERFERALAALALLPRAGRRSLALETIDGLPAREAPLSERLFALGFVPDGRWLVPGERRAARDARWRARGKEAR